MKKSVSNPAAVEAYIACFPPGVRKRLEAVRAAIRAKAPDAVERICYGIPTFTLNGRNLVHFAGWKEHVGFYPSATGIAAFRKELGAYEVSRGTVRLPNDARLPVGLIGRIAAFRVKAVRGGAR